jgi:hypothetical protein
MSMRHAAMFILHAAYAEACQVGRLRHGSLSCPSLPRRLSRCAAHKPVFPICNAALQEPLLLDC